MRLFLEAAEVGVAHRTTISPTVRPELLTPDACYIRLAGGRRKGPTDVKGQEGGSERTRDSRE